MEKSIIESWVASIPRSPLGEEAADHEIWEEQDGGAYFEVTRHLIPVPGEREIIGLTVSGEPDERKRVIKEFGAVLGIPERGHLALHDPDHVDLVTWLL